MSDSPELPHLDEEQVRTWTLAEKDRWWFENVWRGEARSAVNFKASREKRRERVEQAVQRILGDLPAVSQ